MTTAISNMQTMTFVEFKAAVIAQGVPQLHVAFSCPICGTVQSATDLIRAGAGKNFEDVQRYLGFSCVGRWTKAGPHKKGTPPGDGCNWTLGGLFSLHKLEVITDDGKANPFFEPASREDAEAHMLENTPRPADGADSSETQNVVFQSPPCKNHSDCEQLT